MSAVGGATWALVPVRSLAGAKSRLAPVLSPSARRALQEAMLADVLDALARARALDAVAVVTGDAAAAGVAQACGARVVDEGGTAGLNAAVAAATSALCGLGAGRVAVLPADVPLVEPGDVDRAVRLAGAPRGPVVVPDRHGLGTNMLVVRAAAPPVFAFGPDSFARHADPGRDPEPAVLHLRSLALDVDTPGDLALLEAADAGATRTHAALERLRHSVLVREGDPL